MFDFNDVHMSTKDEQVRAFSVEAALNFSEPSDSAENVVARAKMIETYIISGTTSNMLSTAVEEGMSEGRMQVKEDVETMFPGINLDDMFLRRGWWRKLPTVTYKAPQKNVEPMPDKPRFVRTHQGGGPLWKASRGEEEPLKDEEWRRANPDYPPK